MIVKPNIDMLKGFFFEKKKIDVKFDYENYAYFSSLIIYKEEIVIEYHAKDLF